ncbi:hypothetical protein SAMN05421833_120100 [Microbispora rosea]|uniref:Uncharacterized protein n=1 Tax=Microbispora rosea TaxID=58117 RepID=A0A1N7F396_9ACTN|nr:hypothetical protein [Microbispora rosea]GIH48641.1 hypothetical protein Mro03_38200 [Microbispora rosea subsp. rosea]SIR94759.1 hypothetical protein SAMN05421833_120100 [Microbispora rosea]
MTTAASGRGRGEQSGQNRQSGQNEQGPVIPPDPTSLEAWIRQVLGLAGARASAFTPPLPPSPPAGPGHPGRSADADGPDHGGNAE